MPFQETGCGVRFIADLENSKSTMELGKAIHVLNVLKP